MQIQNGVRAIKLFDESAPVTRSITFAANTFSNEVSSQFIKDEYNKAARFLATKSPKVETYLWHDEEGWERVGTILQTPSGYVMVGAACSNDNDAVFIVIEPGKFTQKDARKLPTHELPRILRCDWPARPR